MWIEKLNRKYLPAVCIIICLGYLILGLWPFNFLARNKAAWLPDGRGISFRRPSILYSERALDLQESADSLTIVLYLQPTVGSAKDPGSIVSLYNREEPANLVIGQRRSEILLQIPALDERGKPRFQQVAVNAGLRPGSRRFVAITLGTGDTAVYLDGVLTKAYPKLIVRPESLRGRLIFGSLPEGRGNWEGWLFGTAVFSRALSSSEIARHHQFWAGNGLQELPSEPGLSALYFFNEGTGRVIRDHSDHGRPLVIPEFFNVLHRTVLLPPWKDSRSIKDIAINIVGFVPFGFFYFLYRMQTAAARTLRNVVMTALVSGIISMAIELIQVYLPTRASQLMDIICNVGGSLIGVLIATALLSIQIRAPHPQN